MNQSLLGSYEAIEEQRDSPDKSAQLPEENSLDLTRFPSSLVFFIPFPMH